MSDLNQEFIKRAILLGALKFGNFILKSGRCSPYFFDISLFNDGSSIKYLGNCYAKLIIKNQIEFDILCGAAYKGIPIVIAVALALEQYGYDVPWCFNRKELKNHGEGGIIIGKPLKGRRVLIVDDVITAGTAVKELISIIKAHDAMPVGIIVTLDRQERGYITSAVNEIKRCHNINITSLISFEDLLEYIKQYTTDNSTFLKSMFEYKNKYF